uniref:Gamma tubulin complex component C-terminal domain-containing protein n=2 Tax=Craspedostauros australis TaxID=1486917 RepID=A0A7R9ZK22_9STRA|mmetsp:Transcript_1667/g.4605  ORF Transcript_1667/g.4605 Transcript_1667/m.4605 type:complete len:119 (+) Transcript_1667:55-411(+)
MDLAAERQTAVQANLNVGVVSKDKRSLHQSLTRLREETVSLTLRQSYRVDREVSSPAYQQMIHQFGEVFTTDLADFMTHLNSHTATGVMANLGVRLDYNGFVAASIAARSTPTAARMR